MEYRVTLVEINNFTHLLNSHVERYYQLTIRTFEYYTKNMSFLLNFLKNYRKYSNKKEDFDSIDLIHQQLERLNERIIGIPFEKFKREVTLHKALYDILNRLALILTSYKVKGIILPGNSHTEFNRALKDEGLIRKLIDRSSAKDVLLLQVKDTPKLNDLTLFYLQKGLDVALIHIQEWPAVFFWDEQENLFLKLTNMDHLQHILMNLNDFTYLRSLQQTLEPDAYLLHLSDLHLGSRSAKAEGLLHVIDQNILSRLHYKKIYPLISGDLVDSARQKNLIELKEYIERLKSLGLEEPITIKGNHDVYIKGIFKILKLFYRFRSYFSEETGVVVLEDERLIIIKFDSNEGGHCIGADGGISRQQYRKIEKELSQIEDLNRYTIVAMLHHHVIHFPKIRSEHRIKRTFEGYKRFRLNRYEKYIDWLNEKNVRIVLHGHRHEQHFGETGNIKIFACGSSTGKMEMVEEGKKNIYYNLFSIKNNKPAFCFMYYVDEKTMETKKLRMIRLDK